MKFCVMGMTSHLCSRRNICLWIYLWYVRNGNYFSLFLSLSTFILFSRVLYISRSIFLHVYVYVVYICTPLRKEITANAFCAGRLSSRARASFPRERKGRKREKKRSLVKDRGIHSSHYIALTSRRRPPQCASFFRLLSCVGSDIRPSLMKYLW